jgi:hypothetical protein
MNITGTVVYKNIEGGIWGIVDAQNKKWQVVNMPEQIRKPDLSVNIEAELLADEVSFAMWGRPVRIISFQPLVP